MENAAKSRVLPRLLFIVDAHRADVRARYVVRADDLLTAFLALQE